MATICELNKKPEISYPNFWSYRVVTENVSGKKDEIKEIVKEHKHSINFSKHSKGGKYISFEVSVFVASDNQRLMLFEELKKISKFVL